MSGSASTGRWLLQLDEKALLVLHKPLQVTYLSQQNLRNVASLESVSLVTCLHLKWVILWFTQRVWCKALQVYSSTFIGFTIRNWDTARKLCSLHAHLTFSWQRWRTCTIYLYLSGFPDNQKITSLTLIKWVGHCLGLKQWQGSWQWQNLFRDYLAQQKDMLNHCQRNILSHHFLVHMLLVWFLFPQKAFRTKDKVGTQCST